MPEKSADALREGRPQLVPWLNEFRDSELEKCYRQHFHAEFQRMTLAGTGIVAVTGAWFLFTDCVQLARGGSVSTALVARSILVLVAGALIPIIRAPTYSARVDHAIFLGLCAIGALALSVESTRPSSYLGHIGLDVVFIIAIYLMIPIPFSLQMLAAGAYTVAELALIYLLRDPLDALNLLAIPSALLVGNLVGLAAARRMAYYHRAQFYMMLKERQALLDLEAALGEVQTLSGLLPICCVCKNIRDDDGYWTSVETYLSSHLNASLTHGLCPDCLAKQREAFGVSQKRLTAPLAPDSSTAVS